MKWLQALGLAAAALAGPAHAQGYPTHPITLVVPFRGAGTFTD